MGDLGKTSSAPLGQAVVPRGLLLCWWHGREAGQGAGQCRGGAGLPKGQAKVHAVLFLEAVLGLFYMSWGFPSAGQAGGSTSMAESCCHSGGGCSGDGCSGTALEDACTSHGSPQHQGGLHKGVWRQEEATESSGLLCSSPSPHAGP